MLLQTFSWLFFTFIKLDVNLKTIYFHFLVSSIILVFFFLIDDERADGRLQYPSTRSCRSKVVAVHCSLIIPAALSGFFNFRLIPLSLMRINFGEEFGGAELSGNTVKVDPSCSANREIIIRISPFTFSPGSRTSGQYIIRVCRGWG